MQLPSPYTRLHSHQKGGREKTADGRGKSTKEREREISLTFGEGDLSERGRGRGLLCGAQEGEVFTGAAVKGEQALRKSAYSLSLCPCM